MQDQRIPDEAPTGHISDEHTDSVVLDFMLLGGGWLWSMDEIVRELGDAADAEDAVRRLIETGLAYRLGDFYFPTRTARRAAQLEVGGTV
jgi:hypothetical protein